MLDLDVSANAIKKIEEVKHKKIFWQPVKKQKGKDSLWLIHEMLDRKDTFFRDMPIDEAHMATLHFGSKKNLEYVGSTYDAPVVNPTEMQKANDDRKWKIIKKHIMLCDEENQTRLFIKNGFKKDGFELARGSNCAMYKTNKAKWVRDPDSNRTPDQFSWNDAFYSKKTSVNYCLGYGGDDGRSRTRTKYCRIKNGCVKLHRILELGNIGSKRG
jgi:hypothetical protein